MQPHLLIPYEELSAQLTQSEGLRLEVPWLQVELEVNKPTLDIFYEMSREVGSNCLKNKYWHDLDPSKLLSFMQLFYPIEDLPFFYKRKLTTIKWKHLDPDLCIDLKLKRVKRFWLEKKESILKVAQIDLNGLQYDPLCLLTAIRRQHLIMETRFRTVEKLHFFIQESDIECSKLLIENAVLQNYHITRNACEILENALPMATKNQTDQILRDFIYSETNHDKLLKSGLNLQQDLAKMNSSTQDLIELFRLFSKKNFFCFCVAIDLLELDDELDIDEFSKIADEKKLSKIAKAVRSHHKINQNENHNKIAERILGDYGFFTKKQAINVLKACELFSFKLIYFSHEIKKRALSKPVIKN